MQFGVFPLETGAYWEFAGRQSLRDYVRRFSCLKAVCLVNFKFLELETTVADFILRSAPELEKCIIVKANRYPGPSGQELDFVSRYLSSGKFVAKIYNHNEPYQPI